MNVSRGVNTWGPAVLAVVCIFLGIRLYSEMKKPLVHASRSVMKISAPAASTHHERAAGIDAASASTLESPLLRLSLVKDLEERPLPEIARNPFDFAPLAPPKHTEGSGGAGASAAASGPPPPPPIPLKAFGFSVDNQGRREAYLADAKEVYVVSKGTVVSKRFKVLQITPSLVEVEDATSGQKAELPIPRQK